MPDVIPSSCSTVMSAMSGYEPARSGSTSAIVSSRASAPASTSWRAQVAVNVFVMLPTREWSSTVASAPPPSASPYAAMCSPFSACQTPIQMPVRSSGCSASTSLKLWSMAAASSASIGVVLRSMPVNSADSGATAVVAGAAVVAVVDESSPHAPTTSASGRGGRCVGRMHAVSHRPEAGRSGSRSVPTRNNRRSPCNS